jgi:hypothetical protein
MNACDGASDVDALRALSFEATTSPGLGGADHGGAATTAARAM